jgi:hypothetical protein
LFAPSLDSSYYVDVIDMDGNGTNNNNNLHSHQTNNNNLSNGPHHHHHHHGRQKRVRTSFKHHQLRCMRSYFNLNHNPGLNYFTFFFINKFKLKKFCRCKRFKKSC